MDEEKLKFHNVTEVIEYMVSIKYNLKNFIKNMKDLLTS